MCLVVSISLSALLFTSVPARANRECTLVLQQLLSKMMISEDSLLSQFYKTPIVSAKALNDYKSVYLVETATGKYVVRFDGFGDIVRESFVVGVARKSPLRTIPNVLPISADHLSDIKAALKPIVDKANYPIIEKSKNASVSVFYNATLGDEYLEKSLNGSLEKFFFESRTNAKNFGHPSDFKNEFVKALNAATQAEKDDMVRITKVFYPEQSTKASSDVIQFLYHNLGKEVYQMMELYRIMKLPKSLVSQLSDAWALYGAFGVMDFHPQNWLIHGDTVLPIDFAFPKETDPRFISERSHPFTKATASPQIFNYLNQNVSAEMKAYLKSIQPETLLEAAKAAGYPIQPGEVDFIMKRIQSVLRHTSKP